MILIKSNRIYWPLFPRWWWMAVFFYSSFSLCLFQFLWEQTDTASYTNAIRLLAGESGAPDRLFRLTKPLALLFPAACYRWLGLAPMWGLWLQQYLAYWLGAGLLYCWLRRLFPQRFYLAQYGVLAYLGMQPLAVYGLAMLTDGLGWCAFLWGLYAAQRVLWEHQWRLGPLLGLGLYWGLACLVKESVLVAGLWGAWLVLLRVDWAGHQKLGAYALLGSGFAGGLILSMAWTKWSWGISLLDWIRFGQQTPPPFSWSGFGAQAYHTLDAFWWLVGLGMLSLIWHRPTPRLLWVSVGSTLSGWMIFPWVWPYCYDRILFMLVPPLLPLLAWGSRLLGRWALRLLVLGGIGHLLITYTIYRYQVGGLIIPFGLFYATLVGYWAWRNEARR